MKVIDIITAQNVTIQYTLAQLRERIAAFVIDMVILSFTILMLSILLPLIFSGYSFNTFRAIMVWLVFLFYSLALEIAMNGQSFGKRIMGLKIVKITGNEPSAQDFVIRWAFRFIDIWGSLGSIAIMMISGTERSQRLGDVLASTAVIKLNPSATRQLQDILNARTVNTYTPVYPQVIRLKEEDMLFIKKSAERFNTYRNPAHEELLDELVTKVAGQLNIEKVPANKIAFLNTLVHDYVVLSR